MGRYLDLLDNSENLEIRRRDSGRQPPNDDAQGSPGYDKNDINDKSHARVECGAEMRVLRGVRSFRSFLSYSHSMASRSAPATTAEISDPGKIEDFENSGSAKIENCGSAPAAENRNCGAASAEAAEIPSGWGEAEEERAAIAEYDGGIPREWAEGFALLEPDRPPGDVPLRRWQRFVDDVGAFLDGPHLAEAIALGWGPFDLFGCDRDRPYARIDKCGLLWLLNGDRLIELRRDEAAIENRRGMRRRRRRRKPGLLGRALAWELAP